MLEVDAGLLSLFFVSLCLDPVTVYILMHHSWIRWQ